MNKIVSASLDRIEYSSRGFLFAGPLPVNKGGLFYMSRPSVVMPKTTSFFSDAPDRLRRHYQVQPSVGKFHHPLSS